MSASLVHVLWTLVAISSGGLQFDAASGEPAPSEVLLAQPSLDPSPRPQGRLPFFYDLYTFKADGGGTTVVAAFAVEAGKLKRKRVSDGDRYRFNMTLLLADTLLRSVTNRHDSVFVDLPRRMRGEHLLYTHIEVQAVPSQTIRQTVFMTDATEVGMGQMYWEYIEIPDYSGTELMLSDVALGQPDARVGWERKGATLALLPTGQVPSRAFDVYYEIYNLPEGNPYTTDITVERVIDTSRETADDREPIRISFAGESAAGADDTLPELRSVGTPFDKGTYRLTVTVTDLTTGRTATQSSTFEVQSSGLGATMVPALRVAPLIRGDNRGDKGAGS